VTTKELETLLVTYEEFIDIDFVPKYTFYFKTASGDLLFIKTKIRQEAQDYCDLWSGQKGKYKVICAKEVKSKSKLESCGYTCTGTHTRRGQ